jgi:hypothetical protein
LIAVVYHGGKARVRIRGISFGSIGVDDLQCFADLGKYFCMLILYADESYNGSTICMGGWLAHKDVWKGIERDLIQRIAYENRVSERNGLKPLSRYHAADCASCVNEFAGWDHNRQIRLTKRLIEILFSQKKRGLWGIGFGASLEDFAGMFGGRASGQPDAIRKACYRICVLECLKELCLVMERNFPGQKVTIFHDSGAFVAEAQYVFQNFEGCKDQFVSLSPLRWQDCPALQMADLIAYEVMKMAHKRLKGDEAIRKSLQAIMGKKIPGTFAWIRRGAFQEVKSWIDQGLVNL